MEEIIIEVATIAEVKALGSFWAFNVVAGFDFEAWGVTHALDDSLTSTTNSVTSLRLILLSGSFTYGGARYKSDDSSMPLQPLWFWRGLS